MKKLIAVIMITVGLIIGLSFGTQQSQASWFENGHLNGNFYARNATNLVIARKTVPVFKYRTGTCEANNQRAFYGYLHKGSKVFASGYSMSTGGVWIIKSKHQYYHNSRTFFAVGNTTHYWYHRLN